MTNYSNVYNIDKIRADFPILKEKIYGKPLIYLDNGATTQKPQCVIDTIIKYYSTYNSNVHRGVHFLSQKATDAEEQARNTVQSYINAAKREEIIFTCGTTESINMLAYSFGTAHINQGDEIIITRMEHHSNIVPWQEVAVHRKAKLNVVDFNDEGILDIEQLQSFINNRTKIIAVTWVSNTLGTINPIKDIITLAHQHNIKVMIDAAQAIQHLPIDVQALDVDFLVFSGHKIYGPTGIGVLYGKLDLLNQLPPYQTGGSMIKAVTVEKTTYADAPFRFEAGTPHIEGIIGLGAALEYISEIGIENIAFHEHELLTYAVDKLQQIEGVKVLGGNHPKAGAISVIVNNIHPFDIGEIIDKMGIAVRTGHHCCQPIMDFYNVPGTLRISVGLYNTKEEIDTATNAIKKAITMLQ
jgi:cysteine desulfurase/selenocysteine lyase